MSSENVAAAETSPDPRGDAPTARPPAPKPIANPFVRWLAYIGLFLVGFVLYWTSDLIFEKYITGLLSWILVVAMSVAALVIWIVDERRIRDDEPLD